MLIHPTVERLRSLGLAAMADALVELQNNPEAADKVLDSIGERCSLLAQFPFIGSIRDELFPGLRSAPVGNYVVFYLPLAYSKPNRVLATFGDYL